MTNFIPLFPLSIVVYPGERLNLHIFEPRYKQLITDCNTNGKPFGIPTVLNNELQPYGTLVSLVEVTNVHEDGTMDIKTEGIQVFEILEPIHTLPNKLYNGAIVSYPANALQGRATIMQQVLDMVATLHKYLQVEKKFSKPSHLLTAYDVAHHVGLTLTDEYEMLQLLQEAQRQEYLKRKLTKTLLVIQEMQNLKEKIQLNGHFKTLTGL